MKKAIIFDYNRTLFDPEKEKLIQGSKILLTEALFKGYVLFLVTRAEATGIQSVEEMGLRDFFTEIIVSEKKNICDFKKLIARQDIDISKSFVIGDSVQAEIRLGNTLGITTLWFRNGKFKDTIPSKKSERPTFIIRNFREVKKILK